LSSSVESQPESAGEGKMVAGPILALDLGLKRVGVAVSDPLLIAITSIDAIRHTNWKQLLLDVTALVLRFDAQTLVIGFPLRLDGTEGSASDKARNIAAKFARSLQIPVYLQDERMTSVEAELALTEAGHRRRDVRHRVDSEAAAIILKDFISSRQQRILVSPSD
jgi:putative pre-16S rRNA nuclease